MVTALVYASLAALIMSAILSRETLGVALLDPSWGTNAGARLGAVRYMLV